MKFVPCITWIKRGVCKEIPEKIRLTKDELKELIEADAEVLSDDGDEGEVEDAHREMSGEEREIQDEKGKADDLGQYNLDKYDEEDGPSTSATGLKGLMCFPSNDGDPYMTVADEEDESDVEDIQIKPDDNLIAFGMIDEDCNCIEFHVYNENENQFFAHHDILLPTMPLCMEWLNYEADEDVSKHGNYLAVGGMSPTIDVWDVDVVDCLEPAFILGSSKKKKSKKDGHTDAVLDLAWNSRVRHVLASASADFTVALWDMSNGNVVTKLNHCSEKVQSLKWHPFEPQHLLIGSCDELITLVDCRDPDNVAKTWKCVGEVEKVLWNHFNPFHCFASTDKGFVHCVDARTDAILWTLSAHPASCSGLCLSSRCPGLMVTASVDERIKVWDILDNQPSFVQETKLKLISLPHVSFFRLLAKRLTNSRIIRSTDERERVAELLGKPVDNDAHDEGQTTLRLSGDRLLVPGTCEGKLYSLAASPDSPFMVFAGGDNKNHNYKLINLSSYSAVQNRFKDRELIFVDAETEKKCEEPVAEAQNETSVMAMEALNLSEDKRSSAGKSKKKKKSKQENVPKTRSNEPF